MTLALPKPDPFWAIKGVETLTHHTQQSWSLVLDVKVLVGELSSVN